MEESREELLLCFCTRSFSGIEWSFDQEKCGGDWHCSNADSTDERDRHCAHADSADECDGNWDRSHADPADERGENRHGSYADSAHEVSRSQPSQ